MTVHDNYDTKAYQRFVSDMRDAGYEENLCHYRGRFYWEGPAVRVRDEDELQEVIRSTEVPLQWDQLGRTGYIVYPRA